MGERQGSARAREMGMELCLLVPVCLLFYQGRADSRWTDMVVAVAVAMTADVDRPHTSPGEALSALHTLTNFMLTSALCTIIPIL